MADKQFENSSQESTRKQRKALRAKAARDKSGKKYLSAQDAEHLFSTVDETGHPNEEKAAQEHAERAVKGAAVEIDPLSDADPSGSDVERKIRRTAVLFVVLTLLFVSISQIIYGVVRRTSTSSLSDDCTVQTVSQAMRNGVSWGGGFTQFPQEFTVDEADENTGRIEVSVTDTASADALESFSTSQLQATALSINALLNPNINVVIYHVYVNVDDNGNFMHTQLFGFLRPTGQKRNFMTFIWTKATSDSGVNFSCSITGLDEQTTAGIRDQLQSNFASGLFESATEDATEAASEAATNAAEASNAESTSADTEAASTSASSEDAATKAAGASAN